MKEQKKSTVAEREAEDLQSSGEKERNLADCPRLSQKMRQTCGQSIGGEAVNPHTEKQNEDRFDDHRDRIPVKRNNMVQGVKMKKGEQKFAD